MTSLTHSPQFTARFAGFLYVLLIPLGILGIIYVPQTMVVDGDIVASIANIQSNEMLFRLAILSALVTQLVNFFLVVLLYKLLRSAGEMVARIMVLLIVAAVPIAMLNELNHVAVLLALDSAAPSQVLISILLESHHAGVVIAQFFWGLWLFPMGYLIFKSGFIPKIIGILLMIACFGYLVDSSIYFINPDFGIEFSAYLFFGELAISFWLLIRGVNVERWHESNGTIAN